jgi:hypothetical protein
MTSKNVFGVSLPFSAWQRGGGFRYFKLAPSLLETDKWGREVISKAYNAEMLAEALCKIEGFTYAPSDAMGLLKSMVLAHHYLDSSKSSLPHRYVQAYWASIPDCANR